MGRWIGLVGLVVGLLWLARPVQGAPVNHTSGYVVNGGFEGGFYRSGEDLIADGWSRVNLSGDPDWNSTIAFANGGWVERIEKANSQIISVDDLAIGQPYETVLYQRVTGLAPGQDYSFSAWELKMWGGSAYRGPLPSPTAFGSWVGVDPTGGTDPTAPTVIWDDGHYQIDNPAWNNPAIPVTAQGSAVTVFFRLKLEAQRAETQAILDAMELYDAPTVDLATPAGPLAAPFLDFSGTHPPMLRTRGDYRLYFDVERLEGGEWRPIATRLSGDAGALPLVEGEAVTLRVRPYSLQPVSTIWPPTTHVGHPSAPVTLLPDYTPPVAMISGPAPWPAAAPFTVGWAGSDATSGIAGYDVDYRRAGAPGWSRWLSGTGATGATFGQGGQPVAVSGGDEWEFRVRARDRAGHTSGWVTLPPVRLAGAMLSGQVLSVGGIPIPGMQMVASPYDFSFGPVVRPLGGYRLAMATPGTVRVSLVDAQGRTRIPATPVEVGGRGATRDWWVPPFPNVVANPHFEQDGGWSGSWQRVAGGATGEYSAELAAGAAIEQNVTVTAGDRVALAWRGAGVRVTLGGQSWELAPSGGWSYWSRVVGPGGQARLVVEALGGSVRLDQVAVGPPAERRLGFAPVIVR